MNNYNFRLGVIFLSVFFFSRISSAQEPNCVYLANDLYPGSFGGLPAGYIEFQGAIYFAGTGNVNGVELWKLQNGVSTMVVDLNPGIAGSMPNNFTVIGSYLYFSASNGTLGNELYRFDGTTVALVADINPGPNGSFPNTFAVVGSTLYFSANDGIVGFEPWKYDGTTASLVFDMNPGPMGSTPSEIVGFNGDAYFTATTAAHGKELWKYDGVTATVYDLYPGPTGSDIGDLSPIPGKLCFRATDGVLGYELWTFDGTTPTNLNVNPSSDFTPWELTPFGNELFLRGFVASTGYELWKYDGTTASLVMDIRPGTANSNPNNFMAVGNTLYFAANDGTHGNELWKYDGTTASLVADIRPGSSASMAAPSYDPFGFFGDYVFFIADDGTTGNEVWMSDGFTVELGRDIVSGTGTSTPSGLKGIGNILYFTADDGLSGAELWAWNPDADLTDTLVVVTCDNFTSPAGNNYSTPGTYTFEDAIPSVICPGCDSLVYVDLTITDQPGSTLDVTACNEYTSPGGAYFGTVGTYNFTETVPSIACPSLDSIITINLTIVESINPAIVVFSGVIVAQQSGATYQWLDCDNGYAPIPGATDQDFIPNVDGNYAVAITLGCTDTSDCYFVDSNFGIGFNENELDRVSIFPNPTSDELNISSPEFVMEKITVVNNLGETVLIMNPSADVVTINLSQIPSGIYYVRIEGEKGIVVKRISKK